jgi:hypothetical protein
MKNPDFKDIVNQMSKRHFYTLVRHFFRHFDIYLELSTECVMFAE